MYVCVLCTVTHPQLICLGISRNEREWMTATEYAVLVLLVVACLQRCAALRSTVSFGASYRVVENGRIEKYVWLKHQILQST